MPITDIANNINCLGYFKPKQNHVAITHGFRLTFFQWSADKTNYSREICLMADLEIFCNLCD